MATKESGKMVPPGLTMTTPLLFGNWPLERVNRIIKEAESKYDLSKHEFQFVDRGGYVPCRGCGDHEPCGELVKTYGKIVWKRVKP